MKNENFTAPKIDNTSVKFTPKTDEEGIGFDKIRARESEGAENVKTFVNTGFSQDSQSENSQNENREKERVVEKEVYVIHDNLSTVKNRLSRISKYVNKANSRTGKPKTIIDNFDKDFKIIDAAINQADGSIPEEYLQKVEQKRAFVNQYKSNHLTAI